MCLETGADAQVPSVHAEGTTCGRPARDAACGSQGDRIPDPVVWTR